MIRDLVRLRYEARRRGVRWHVELWLGGRLRSSLAFRRRPDARRDAAHLARRFDLIVVQCEMQLEAVR